LVKKVAGRRIVPETAGTHTACGKPPMHARRALDKVTRVLDGHPILATTNVRRDKVGNTGCFTLRYMSTTTSASSGRAQVVVSSS
jgi:hypothetical protein